MGCTNSRLNDQSEGIEPKTDARNEDFDPQAKYDGSKLMQAVGRDHQSSYNIAFQDESLQLPQYEKLPSVDGILQIMRQANRFRLYEIQGAFSIYNERHFDVWIDSNFQLKPDTRNAILLIALFTLQMGKSTNCNMTFYFTSYPNNEQESLGKWPGVSQGPKKVVGYP
ncbi:hypothetical protein ACLOAV_008302 [Pseudogymnoascus australis]